jgi:putative endonuclease
MYYAYVIKSLKDGSFYKGHCSDLEKRLKQHNDGQTESIKSKVPFVIVYSEVFELREEAIFREKYFKTASGRRFIKLKLNM